jgi:hypothetical protein
MPLPHFTQLVVAGAPGGPGTTPQEPVYTNLFEVTFVLPTILQAQGRDPIIFLQQALSIDLGTTNKTLGTSQQRWKYSTRRFLNAGPTETDIESLQVKFNVNVNNQGSMETWAGLRAWYDLGWNSQNGYLHYKADTIGTMIVNQHDKKGLVLRRVTFQNCQLKSITGMGNMDYTNQGIVADVTADFCCDYWIDEYIDGDFTIQPPFVAGY